MKKLNNRLFEIKKVEIDNELEYPFKYSIINTLWIDTSDEIFIILYELKYLILDDKIKFND